MKFIKYILALYIVLVNVGCKDPYYINVDANDLNVLVVEGQITGSNTISYAYLTRSVNVNDRSELVIEFGASVYVQDENGSAFELVYSDPNKRYEGYANTELGKKYRMFIRTSDGKEFASEYTELLNTPDIGDINYERIYDGFALKLNTEDPTNSTKYYHWSFEEDWEIRSPFMSTVWYDAPGNRLIDSVMTDYYICYKSNKSTSIILGTTDNLSSSKLVDHRFHLIANADDRLSVRYSILLRQYASSLEGYKFLDLMRKNTESIGSIFDPQPSELVGNIVCINDPEERVLGFVDASIEKTKRVFINAAQVENWNFRLSCETYNVPSDSMPYYYPAIYLPTERGEAEIPSATSSCVDCRLRGGNNNKPAFW
jgi:hypothetical protein